MSKEKFTPGEWKAVKRQSGYATVGEHIYEIWWSKDGELVADIVYQKEDAYLMAASKELYQELDRCDDLMRDVIMRIPHLSGLVRVIQSQLDANKRAILKARGKE